MAVQTAVEIAVYNVLAWLSEMETGRIYRMRAPHDVFSGLADVHLQLHAAVQSGGTGAVAEAAAEGKVDVSTEKARALASARHIAKVMTGVSVRMRCEPTASFLHRAQREKYVLVGQRYTAPGNISDNVSLVLACVVAVVYIQVSRGVLWERGSAYDEL